MKYIIKVYVPLFIYSNILCSEKIKKVDLVQFIRQNTHECVIKDDVPDQQATYVFWLIMEKFYTQNGVSVLLMFCILF